MDKKIAKIFGFLELAEKLKTVVRYNAAPEVVTKESTADHSWKLAAMVYIIARELNVAIDVDHAVRLALFHDLAEAIAGDVDYRDVYEGKISIKEKEKREWDAAREIREMFSDAVGEEFFSLWQEYEEATTPEGRFVKALDKMEAVDHLICLGHEQFDIPDKIATYCDTSVSNCPDAIPLYREIKKRLKAEYETKGWEWRAEYDQV